MELIQLAVPVLLKGLWVTAALTLVSVLIGFNLGLGLALMRLSSNAFSAGKSNTYPILESLLLELNVPTKT